VPLPAPMSEPQSMPEDSAPAVPEMMPPAPGMAPTPESAAAEPSDTVHDMQDQLRRLRAELDASRQRQETMESRSLPSRRVSAYDRGAERRQQRLDAVRDQLQGSPTPPNYRENPYSVGTADRGWQPNTGY
jgi:hypothetical protein